MNRLNVSKLYHRRIGENSKTGMAGCCIERHDVSVLEGTAQKHDALLMEDPLSKIGVW